MRAVMTGSDGFIGRVLRGQIAEPTALHMAARDWRESLEHIDFGDTVVFHLAGRAHEAQADEATLMRDNVEKTEALAEAAARGGASRFIFVSTLKVHGEETAEHAFTAQDRFDPRDAYARSKQRAEERLTAMAERTGLAITIVRPPLVFGPGAKANLRDALRFAATPWPLPFAGIANRRSWIHVDDLCALLLACAQDPRAVGRSFIACHTRPFATPELIGGLRARLGRPRRLFRMRTSTLETLASLAGNRDRMRRLTRSLEGDPSATREALGWIARVPFSTALDDLVRGASAS